MSVVHNQERLPSGVAKGVCGFLCCLACAALLSQQALAGGKRVTRAYVDSDGALHIVGASGHETKPGKDKDQVAFSSPQIALDNQTVGWLAEFPNCCTSYPIPLSLVIYRNGNVIQRFHDAQMMVSWRFLADGKRVAFCTNTVHGDIAPHCELHDVNTGRQLQVFDGSSNDKRPTWMDGLSTD
jgi:hypothetical protein